MKTIWNGPKDLQRLRVAIADLHHDPHNPRKHGARNIESIKASFFQFGQLRPIVVQRSTMRVVAGNGQMRAAAELGWTHIAALVADLTDAQARAFSVADNRTAELAEWDQDNLAAILRDPALDELLGATGFNAAELERLMDRAEADLAGVVAAPDPATVSAPRTRDDVDEDQDNDDDEDAADTNASEVGLREGFISMLRDMVERIDAGAQPAELRDHLVHLLGGFGVTIPTTKKGNGRGRRKATVR